MFIFTCIWRLANVHFGPCIHFFRKDLNNCIELLFFTILCKPFKVVLAFLIPSSPFMLLPENTKLMPSDILLWVNVWWFQALLFLSYRLFCAVCGRFFCAFNDSFSPAQRKSLMRAQPLSLSFLKNTFPRLSPHAFHFSLTNPFHFCVCIYVVLTADPSSHCVADIVSFWSISSPLSHGYHYLSVISASPLPRSICTLAVTRNNC